MKCPLEPEEHEDLLEIEMGDWVGQHRNIVYTKEVLDVLAVDPWTFAPPNGESPKQVEERMVRFFNSHVVPLSQTSTSVAVFGHGYAFKTLLRHILEFSPLYTHKIHIHNTSITLLGFCDPKYRVFWVNDISHLVVKNILVT